MGRDFTKNTANYLTLGSGILGGLLHGASAISAHFHVTLDTKEAFLSSFNQDDAVHVWISNSHTGLSIVLTSPNTDGTVEVAGRSRAGGTKAFVKGTTILSTGTTYRIGGVWDYGNVTARVYVNGTQENTNAATGWEDLTYVNSSPTTALDTIGCNATTGTAPEATTRQVDGSIAEVAIWSGDIGTAAFVALNQGIPASRVRPDILVCYLPLLGYASPELDLLGAVSGTITGTVAKRDHPRTTNRTRRKPWAVPTAVTVSTTHHVHLPLLGVG